MQFRQHIGLTKSWAQFKNVRMLRSSCTWVCLVAFSKINWPSSPLVGSVFWKLLLPTCPYIHFPERLKLINLNEYYRLCFNGNPMMERKFENMHILVESRTLHSITALFGRLRWRKMCPRTAFFVYILHMSLWAVETIRIEFFELRERKRSKSLYCSQWRRDLGLHRWLIYSVKRTTVSLSHDWSLISLHNG